MREAHAYPAVARECIQAHRRAPGAGEPDTRSDNEVMRAAAGAQLEAEFWADMRAIRRGIFG